MPDREEKPKYHRPRIVRREEPERPMVPLRIVDAPREGERSSLPAFVELPGGGFCHVTAASDEQLEMAAWAREQAGAAAAAEGDHKAAAAHTKDAAALRRYAAARRAGTAPELTQYAWPEGEPPAS